RRSSDLLMHALGFSHEFDRPENWPPECKLGVLAEGNTFGTAFDPLSIMNYSYCDGPGVGLSPWDVVGIQNAFGRKPAGSIVGFRDNCVFTPSLSSGTLVRTGNCVGTDPDLVEAGQRER